MSAPPNQREGNDQLHQLRQGGILHQEEDTQEHENCGLNVMLVSINTLSCPCLDCFHQSPNYQSVGLLIFIFGNN